MYVYVVRAAEAVKIGKATVVKQRMSMLQTGSPHRLELIGTVQCWTDAKALEVEAQAHRDLYEFRVSGEWFTYTPEVQSYVADLLKTEFPMPAPLSNIFKKKAPTPAPRAYPAPTDSLIPIPKAAEMYGIDLKRLRGYVWRNGLTDPIGCVQSDQVYDDWRLQRFAA